MKAVFLPKTLIFSELPIFSVCPSVSSYICDHADMRETQETAAPELKSAGLWNLHVICHFALRTIANHRKRPPPVGVSQRGPERSGTTWGGTLGNPRRLEPAL